MNKDAIYQRVFNALLALDENNNEHAKQDLQFLRSELEKDLQRDTARANGNGARQKAAMRILKSNIKQRGEEHSLSYAYTTDDGKQVICDGFRLAILNSPLPLPDLPEGRDYIKYNQFVPQITPSGSLPLPNLATLKAYIKHEKARQKNEKVKNIKVVYSFGVGLPSVNAEALADMMEVFPDVQELRYNGTRLNPLYFYSDFGFGLLMPLNNITEKDDEAQNERQKAFANKSI